MVEPREREVSWAEFAHLWERFLEESVAHPGTVVVEGERDRESLRRLGVRAPIVLVHHGRPMSELAQDLASSRRRVIVLTDWDTEGGHLAQRLKEFLGDGSGNLDLDFRRRLARVLRGEVVHVEGLAGWARRLAQRDGASADVFVNEG